MRNKLFLATMVSLALAGCNDETRLDFGTTPDTIPPTDVLPPDILPPEPEPEPEPEPTIMSATFTLDGTKKFSAPVMCNGEAPTSLAIEVGDTVICEYNGLVLASFNDVRPDQARTANGESTDAITKNLTLSQAEEFVDKPTELTNAQKLINTFGVNHGEVIQLPTDTTGQLKFKNLFEHDLHLNKEAFAELLEEDKNEQQADKLPSAHVPDVEPVVTPGTSTELTGSFVAANAESIYQYQPAEVILTEAKLLDSNGIPVAGINYYSNASRGVTGTDGSFEFSWGETISFGIDTFELGSVRGNKNTIRLTDLGAGNRGLNTENLVQRYGQHNGDALTIPSEVISEFAKYPNVINEIINLSLSAQDTELDLGGGKTQIVSAEFNQQFDTGLAQEIDNALCQTIVCSAPTKVRAIVKAIDDNSQILADIQRLWGSSPSALIEGYLQVDKFHVFHDSTWYYGSTGNARGQGAVNISNTAFPIMMARNDHNYWIAFDQKKAWDDNKLAYITEAPSKVKPDNVGPNSATFNLPFVSLGELGAGKIMMIGNARYNSVLVCPNGYSWDGSKSNTNVCNKTDDSDDMKSFFKNSFKYLVGKESNFTIGTNIPSVYFKHSGHYIAGPSAAFEIHSDFGVETLQLSNFTNINPAEIPVLILNGFEYKLHEVSNDLPLSADTSRPKLSEEDTTALIDYVNRGGNILIMETVIQDVKSSALNRLLDAAGIALNPGRSVVPYTQGYPDRVRSQRDHDFWVIERYDAMDGEAGEQPKAPYIIHPDGTVDWHYQLNNKPQEKPKLSVASWTEIHDGQEQTVYAFVDTAGKTTEEIAAEKAHVLAQFTTSDGKPAYAECTDDNYHYEVNCLERRPGTNLPLTGGMFVPRYTELDLNEPVAKAMLKAADLGTNIERLYQHELYFRTKGTQGERLPVVDLKRIYQNMTVWLWNDLDYRFDGSNDDLGFERFTQYLNCYSNNQAASGTTCPADLKASMLTNHMILGTDAEQYVGYMNPSYPLNYMEKPLTRLMLGRSFYDYAIKVDIRQFPGEASGSAGGGDVVLNLSNNTTAWFAGNGQPTGQWAVAHRPFTVSSDAAEPVTISVALHDNLTGLDDHELGMKRPPRMTKTFTIEAYGSTTFTVPYGGLIYARGNSLEPVTLTFTDTVDAPLYQLGKGWVNDINSPAPIGDLVSNSFVYTAPKKNFNAKGYHGGIEQYAKDLDTFSADLNDFYARDEIEGNGKNRQATSAGNPNNRHHFVNDIAISIGAAHSGYPVMNGSFSANKENFSTAPLNDWLLSHEVGHNAAEAPFNVAGAGEVVNNLLALHQQDIHTGKMTRVESDIRIAPTFVAENKGEAWALGGPAERLLMFAQLKEWAESNFDINLVYTTNLPNYYSEISGVKGWNLFKLMHRLTRNQADPDIKLPGDNMCYQQGLAQPDALMLCASYATQTDLTTFFRNWSPGSKAEIYPGDPTPKVVGGISAAGQEAVRKLNLPQPSQNPLSINTITVRQ